MKKYSLSFGASLDHKPQHPDRTAKRTVGWDLEFQVWPSRASMAKSIRMQQQREPKPNDWRACVALTDGEGYGPAR